jgi:hypothetical protein
MSTPRKPLILSRPAKADEACVRVRLNANTIVLLKDLRSFEQWRTKYPGAYVMDGGKTPKKAAAAEETSNEAPQ